uniref:GDSL esterase/lipase n=1 Tax=Vitis vinifera TaxID=29760 RepID=A5BN91_VITVI|nr:hypothetical protein VITISV_007009 [Vitis vinifera]
MVLGLDLPPRVYGEQQVPCIFIFGDSMADNGNNNGLVTKAKANYQPYGIDFPTGATGRMIITAEFLGFNDSIKPFAIANGRDILEGVNYASGAAGIREETGQQQGDRISMDRQLQNHQTIVSRIANMLGNDSATKSYLAKCIYLVGMGSNDYVNNYYMPKFYTTSLEYAPEQYAIVLIQQFSLQLRTLYGLGARKVALDGLGLLGCTPKELATYGTNGSSCVQFINDEVQFFNDRLRLLVDELNSNLTNANFIYVNTSGILSTDPALAGFRVVGAPCCEVGSSDGLGTCLSLKAPCLNRAEYVFWDAFHPTEAVNIITATRSYNARSPFDAYPVDIYSLAQL